MDKNIHIPINDTHLQLQMKLHNVLQIKNVVLFPILFMAHGSNMRVKPICMQT